MTSCTETLVGWKERLEELSQEAAEKSSSMDTLTASLKEAQDKLAATAAVRDGGAGGDAAGSSSLTTTATASRHSVSYYQIRSCWIGSWQIYLRGLIRREYSRRRSQP